MEWSELAILVAGGLVAGVVNTLAGGGSLLTVPLLVLLGLPGTLANGTNRVGILVQNLAAAWRFRRDGISDWRQALPVVVPVILGSVVGAFGVSRLSDQLFEQIFGIVMVIVLIPTLRPPKRPDPEAEREGDSQTPSLFHSPVVQWLLYFTIGIYGGAFQAGVGIFLMLALARTGVGLVLGNAIKVVVVAVLTAVAVPIFLFEGQVAWVPAGALTIGFAAGGVLGARLSVVGGERLIRPVLLAAVIAMAGKMLDFY